jgi:hypothetical protein
MEEMHKYSVDSETDDCSALAEVHRSHTVLDQAVERWRRRAKKAIEYPLENTAD